MDKSKPLLLPSVSLTSPVVGTNYVGPATIALAATAADTDGSIAKVAYYRDAVLIGTATVAPYAFNWGNAPAGTYSITARATDNAGNLQPGSTIYVTLEPCSTQGRTPACTQTIKDVGIRRVVFGAAAYRHPLRRAACAIPRCPE